MRIIEELGVKLSKKYDDQKYREDLKLMADLWIMKEQHDLADEALKKMCVILLPLGIGFVMGALFTTIFGG